ncbi:hypothetical protein [Botrimarina sp.]|uniref:hypothetical protein n=1 Tax=Botrimarina sp. TaxID=2795802 RepID=UPI0032EDB808
MAELHPTGDALWDRIENAVQKVKDRLRRVSTALEAAGVPYAVVGGNAVQVWVAQVDESLVRNTRDVDIVIERSRLADAIAALEPAGFVYRHAKGVDMFLDGPAAKARDAVGVVFAGEKVRDSYPEPVPTLDEAELVDGPSTLSLGALVRMKLTSYRDKDRTHLRDMIDAELIDATWPSRLPSELGKRLQAILDTPLG